MLLGKVIGQVVSSQKNQKCQGMKLLYVQPFITKEGKWAPTGNTFVAVDSVGAGKGEFVMFTQGSSARFTDATKDAPVDTVIIGIVDSIEVEGKLVNKP